MGTPGLNVNGAYKNAGTVDTAPGVGVVPVLVLGCQRGVVVLNPARLRHAEAVVASGCGTAVTVCHEECSAQSGSCTHDCGDDRSYDDVLAGPLGRCDVG